MQNVDAQELAKFSELAHRWWDPESEFRPLHQINPLRLNWIDELAGLRGKTVLDVGCGGGILTESMAGRCAHATGIDRLDHETGVLQPRCDQVLAAGIVGRKGAAPDQFDGQLQGRGQRLGVCHRSVMAVE